MAVKEMRGGGTRVEKEPEDATARTLAPVGVAVEETGEGPVGTRLYWMGTLDQCPYQNLELAGHSFPRRTQRVWYAEGERTPNKVERRGSREWLSDTDVQQIKAAGERNFLRQVGGRGVKMGPREKRTRLLSDRVLGSYVYCLPVEEAARLLGPNWQDSGTPPPLLVAM